MTFGPDEMGRLKEIVLGRHGASPVAATAATYEFVEGLRRARYLDGPRGSRAKPITSQAQGGGGLRQRHGRRLRAQACWRRLGVRGDPARRASSDYIPSRATTRTPRTWRCSMPSPTKVKEHRRRCGAGLRRRWRPLRRGGRRGRGDLRRQDRRHAGPRSLGKLHPGVDLRGRREIHRALSRPIPSFRRSGRSRRITGRPGHSYIKRRVNGSSARWPGFEKSGHFFFNEPIGRGYDDGLLTAHRGDRDARPQPR